MDVTTRPANVYQLPALALDAKARLDAAITAVKAATTGQGDLDEALAEMDEAARELYRINWASASMRCFL